MLAGISVLGQRVTLASKPPPMILAARACSRAASTAERTCASRSHFSAASLANPQARDSASGKSAMWTLSGSVWDFGRYFQVSSEVNTRIGAARRTRALEIFQTAVCAERRDLFLGAMV